MFWAMLPPEINSARMYAGPGPGSLLSAASAWDGLAAELQSTAQSYGSVVSELVGGPWLGPASASMAAAAAPYVTWTSATAAQAQQTAVQARTAVAAFEQALAMTVPPPAIAANRTLLQSLVATNILGQNTPAIMATEAAYAEMWAQDAAAMYGYAAGSAAATQQMTPFIAPQQNANPAGPAAQGAAVSQAATTSAGNAQTAVSQLTSALLQAPSGTTSAATPAQAITLDNLWGYIWDIEGGSYDGLAGLGVLTAVSNTYSVAAKPAGIPLAQSLASGIGPVLNKIVGGLGALNGGAVLHGAGLGGGGVAAAVGQAASLGPLSVPSGWAVPATTATTTLSGTPLTTLPAAAEAGMPGVPGYPGMPLAGTARGGGVVPRYGVRLAVMARPLSGG